MKTRVQGKIRGWVFCEVDTTFALLSMFGSPAFGEFTCGMLYYPSGASQSLLALEAHFGVQDLTRKVLLTLGDASIQCIRRMCTTLSEPIANLVSAEGN